MIKWLIYTGKAGWGALEHENVPGPLYQGAGRELYGLYGDSSSGQ